jgi:hypothetical protein
MCICAYLYIHLIEQIKHVDLRCIKVYKVQLTVNNKTYRVNDKQIERLSTAPILWNRTVMIPASWFVQELGGRASYSAK